MSPNPGTVVCEPRVCLAPVGRRWAAGLGRWALSPPCVTSTLRTPRAPGPSGCSLVYLGLARRHRKLSSRGVQAETGTGPRHTGGSVGGRRHGEAHWDAAAGRRRTRPPGFHTGGRQRQRGCSKAAGRWGHRGRAWGDARTRWPGDGQVAGLGPGQGQDAGGAESLAAWPGVGGAAPKDGEQATPPPRF